MTIIPPTHSCRVRVLTRVLALTSALLVPNVAVCADSCGSLERLTVALRFAQAVYPELKGKDFGVSFSPGNGTFVSVPTQADYFMIRVDNPIWLPPGETVGQYYAADLQAVRSSGIELPLNLSFDFIKVGPSMKRRELACHPLKFTGDVGYTQMEKVWRAINPHPEWSDAEELETARKLGLRYGPEDKDALLQLIPLKDLSRFYGPLQIKNAEFRMNGGQKCAGCSFANPNWYITASEVGSTHGLLIIVEPFFGKITSIGE
jgi:hypothetical protein